MPEKFKTFQGITDEGPKWKGMRFNDLWEVGVCATSSDHCIHFALWKTIRGYFPLEYLDCDLLAVPVPLENLARGPFPELVAHSDVPILDFPHLLAGLVAILRGLAFPRLDGQRVSSESHPGKLRERLKPGRDPVETRLLVSASTKQRHVRVLGFAVATKRVCSHCPRNGTIRGKECLYIYRHRRGKVVERSADVKALKCSCKI